MAAGAALVEVTDFADEKEEELLAGAASTIDGETICNAANEKRKAGIRFRKVTLSVSLDVNELERSRSYIKLEPHYALTTKPYKSKSHALLHGSLMVGRNQ